MTPRRIAALPRWIAWVLVVGCNSRPSESQCDEILDRYVDMVLAGDPALANESPLEAQAARDARKAFTKADPRYRHAEEQCKREVSRRQYRCAMKAPTPETWQACID